MKLWKRGFTLNELLVTMAIIGILATIVYGKFTNARALTRDSSRIETLDMLSGALDAYYAQYHVYPCGNNDADDDAGSYYGWPDYNGYSGDNTLGTKSISTDPGGFLAGGAHAPGCIDPMGLSTLNKGLYTEKLITTSSIKDPVNDAARDLVYVYYVDYTRQHYMLATHLEARTDLMKTAKDGGACDDVYELGPLRTIQPTPTDAYPIAWEAADVANKIKSSPDLRCTYVFP
jgi:prepilin-type N-terminal cleavage/methylation domain-containing protein